MRRVSTARRASSRSTTCTWLSPGYVADTEFFCDKLPDARRRNLIDAALTRRGTARSEADDAGVNGPGSPPVRAHAVCHGVGQIAENLDRDMVGAGVELCSYPPSDDIGVAVGDDPVHEALATTVFEVGVVEPEQVQTPTLPHGPRCSATPVLH